MDLQSHQNLSCSSTDNMGAPQGRTPGSATDLRNHVQDREPWGTWAVEHLPSAQGVTLGSWDRVLLLLLPVSLPPSVCLS